jgi:hypothetical protein
MPNPNEVVDVPGEISIRVTRSELRLIRAALEEFLASFSHDEGDVVDRIKAVLSRLPDEERETGKSGETSSFQRLTL